MAFRFKCPVQKLAVEQSETTFNWRAKYEKIVLEHYFNHSVRRLTCIYVIDNSTLIPPFSELLALELAERLH